MAINNHFFFERLSPAPTQPSTTLKKDIHASFDNIETLRTEMIETGLAMFGNGFVWLYKEDGPGMLRVLCTYNAGSPFPEMHYRRQDRDMSNQYARVGTPPLSAAETTRLSTPANFAGTFGPASESANRLTSTPGGLAGGPILCVNCWQHCWVRDFTVAGKRAYLASWWERINWQMVEQSAIYYGQENSEATTGRAGFSGAVRNAFRNRSQGRHR